MKNYKKFTVAKYRDQDGVWIGRVLELSGCHSYGRTLKELDENLKEAVALCLEEGEGPERELVVEKRKFPVNV